MMIHVFDIDDVMIMDAIKICHGKKMQFIINKEIE